MSRKRTRSPSEVWLARRHSSFAIIRRARVRTNLNQFARGGESRATFAVPRDLSQAVISPRRTRSSNFWMTVKVKKTLKWGMVTRDPEDQPSQRILVAAQAKKYASRLRSSRALLRRARSSQPIYLSHAIATSIKKHQVDGVRFMFDNVIESMDAVKNDKLIGLGCILAHVMVRFCPLTFLFVDDC